jgi:hypothetical protein
MWSLRTFLRGPLFSGKLAKDIARGTDDIEKTVAVEGAAMVRARLNTVLKKQTPIYRFKVRANPDPPGWLIHDQRMIYGPWLEGTGSRNRTTRFKGYRTFRIITQQLNDKAKITGERVMARWIGGS